MSSRPARRRASGNSEARRWKDRHDGLLDVLAAVLHAYGNGPDSRLAVSNAYVGRQRHPIVVDAIGDRLVIRFELPKEDQTHV